ncbi:MAG: ankyrin repeat domain-containing protein [Verrucomicrobiota bacterium JB022]|nr:ankyrin repeat domain-containing protein [Verrucomicrobiota bacterium JB022]
MSNEVSVHMKFRLLLFATALAGLQLSCAGPSSALAALQGMRASRYFDQQVQIDFARAVERGDEARMQDLLEQGADVNAVGRAGMSPLFWALAKRNKVGFQFLLEHGADPNTVARDENGSLILTEVAAIAEDSDYLRLLLEHGANPDQKTGSIGRTLIYDAIMHGRRENVRLLAEAGANLNNQDGNGQTPMMTAAAVDKFWIVRLLLDAGADPEIEDKWGYRLDWNIREYGDRTIPKQSDDYEAYIDVVEELTMRGLLDEGTPAAAVKN